MNDSNNNLPISNLREEQPFQSIDVWIDNYLVENSIKETDIQLKKLFPLFSYAQCWILMLNTLITTFKNILERRFKTGVDYSANTFMESK